MKRGIILICCLLFSVWCAGIAEGQGSRPENWNTATAAMDSAGQQKPVKTCIVSEGKEKINRFSLSVWQDKRALLIHDKHGKPAKEIKLGKTITKINDKDKNGRLRKGERKEIIEAAISENGSKAVIVKYREEILEGIQSYEQPDSTLELEMVDKGGDVKWKKEVGINKELASGEKRGIKTFENGNSIFIMHNNDEMGTDPVLLVYDAFGNIRFKYPEPGSDITISEYVTSPNGKYVGINYSKNTPKITYSVIFFNLSNGKSWDLGRSAGIRKITSEGVATVSGKKKFELETIDLKSKLGE